MTRRATRGGHLGDPWPQCAATRVRTMLESSAAFCASLFQLHVDAPLALILLNDKASKDVLSILWPNCSIKVCADGGANVLRALDSSYVPDFIVGDLDSVTQDNKKYYASKGTQIVHIEDQDTNDLQKCLRHVVQLPIKYRIVICGMLGNRLDQEICNISAMYHYHDQDIYAISRENMFFLLRPGRNVIHVDRRFVGQYCGLLPLAAPVQNVHTAGLRWNLSINLGSISLSVRELMALFPDGRELRMGVLVSSSNEFNADKVEVVCSAPLMFTLRLHPALVQVMPIDNHFWLSPPELSDAAWMLSNASALQPLCTTDPPKTWTLVGLREWLDSRAHRLSLVRDESGAAVGVVVRAEQHPPRIWLAAAVQQTQLIERLQNALQNKLR